MSEPQSQANDCSRYRRALLAEPNGTDAVLQAHLATCAECARFSAGLRRFEGRLETALRVAVDRYAVSPTGISQAASQAAPVVPLRQRPWLAAAASVLLGVGIVGVVWLAGVRRTLAADVVLHMAGEPQAWVRTERPVPLPELATVLRAANLRLDSSAGLITYANDCEFRGHVVPHLVVQTAAGPVTVMLLTHENGPERVRFDESGYRGVIVPFPHHGNIAVLMRTIAGQREGQRDAGGQVVDAVAAQVMHALGGPR